MTPEAVRRRAALAEFAPTLHHYDIDGFPAGEHVGLPSTMLTLVLPVEEPLDLSMPSQGRRRLSSCLGGLHDAPATIHHRGTQRGIQLALDPLRVRQLLGVPAAELTGLAVDLGEVIGDRAAATLAQRLDEAAPWPVRRRLVEEVLLRQAGKHERAHVVPPEVARAWSLLCGSGGTARVADVAAEVGWSTRHLEQQFTSWLGVGPKTVARIARFERSAALVAAGRPLAVVAARCGYADQPHMTRDWRRLAGTTPGQWLHEDVLANVQDGRSGPDEDRGHDLTH